MKKFIVSLTAALFLTGTTVTGAAAAMPGAVIAKVAKKKVQAKKPAKKIAKNHRSRKASRA